MDHPPAQETRSASSRKAAARVPKHSWMGLISNSGTSTITKPEANQ